MRVPARIVAALAALGMTGAAPEPRRLAPAGPWVLDYADNSCRLSRVFGEGKDQTVLQFESTAPGQMSMLAIGRPLDTGLDTLRARFAPVQDKPFDGTPELSAKREPGGLWLSVPFLPEALVELRERQAKARATDRSVRPPPIDLAQRAEERSARAQFAAATMFIELYVKRNQPLILDTGSLAKPIASFDKCSRDSLRDWGVDPEVEDKIVRPVWSPQVHSWFTSDDYPRAMWQEGKESEVRVRLLVDANGAVTSCVSLSHFDAPDFQRDMCAKFTKRAKFEPAELADGTKVPSYYINRVVFRMD